jgi:hypothetical protein
MIFSLGIGHAEHMLDKHLVACMAHTELQRHINDAPVVAHQQQVMILGIWRILRMMTASASCGDVAK